VSVSASPREAARVCEGGQEKGGGSGAAAVQWPTAKQLRRDVRRGAEEEGGCQRRRQAPH